MTYRRDYGKLRLWRSCKTPFRCCGRGSKNPAPLGAGSSNREYKINLLNFFLSDKILIY
ncbi:MAG: hypothetical protein GF383_07680 [Candidatus Lokiarchaeota archaeon]|nr:hypothetical protein [Candidatus Lokiarchaeota archaeon]